MVGKFYVGQATTDFFFFPAAGGSEAGRGGGWWVGWCACTVAHARSRVCEFFLLGHQPPLSLTQTFAPPIGTGLSVLIKRLRAKPKQGSATGGESSGCHSTRANQAQGICDFRCLRAGKSVAARCSRPPESGQGVGDACGSEIVGKVWHCSVRRHPHPKIACALW